jgi:FMN phosphatase YigB (HAD superfamily)
MYGVNFTEEEKIEFDKAWDQDGWRIMPTHDGALEACNLLHQAGYELVCVTAMPARFIEHRLENFRLHEFPIDRIVSSGYDADNFHINPKRKIIEDLHPVAFVDDLRRNFKDIQGVHTKLIFIDHKYHDDPNEHDNIYYDTKYPNLLDFANDFLKSEKHGEDISWAERPSHLLPSV